jgi:glyoxylase-like metal-dependent hydrolase (beta-lactamase superfamily II)
MNRFARSALAAASLVLASCGGTIQGDSLQPSLLFAQRWNSGLGADEPPLQTQVIGESAYAIRQSIAVTFEAPFVYLLIGDERALLIDTGVEGGALRAEVDRLLAQRRLPPTGAAMPLIVMHTHGHSDHVGGDASFAGRADTVIVGHAPADVAAFFGIGNWPHGPAAFDLGGRVVDIVPIPGHHASHVAVHDRATGMLFSGDAVYPGILRFRCDAAEEYLASIERLIAFSGRNDVRWLLGGHIEMREATGEYFQSESLSRNDEHVLELPAPVLPEIRDALVRMGDRPRVQAHDEFVLFPHPADPRGLQPPDWCAAQ